MNFKVSPEDIIYKFDIGGNNTVEEKEFDYIPEYRDVYKKLKSALEINDSGYNIYLIDDFSKDKLNNIKAFVEKILTNKGKPQDICYVVKNDPKNPKVLFLPNGMGVVLKEIIEEIKNCYSENTFNFYNSSGNKEKEVIIDNMQKKRNELVGRLEELAKEYNFEIKITQGGFVFIPQKEGEAMTEKDYEDLDKDRKADILDKVSVLKENAELILDELKNVETDELEKIKKLMSDYYKKGLYELKEKFKLNFSNNNEIISFLYEMCEDIEENIIDIYSINYEEDEEKINEVIFKYEVNVIVDNSDIKSPQVIYEEDPSINNLLGNIEYENHNNVYTTDVTLIKAGSMLKANEGCLILRANNLFTNSQAYYYLKKTLISEKVKLDFNRGYLELLSLSSLNPEPIAIKEKVILIGDYETYDFLYNYDEDFKKIFKIRAEYDPVVEINEITKKALINNIKMICHRDNLRPLTDCSIMEIAKYLSRKAESRKKIYFDDGEINKLLMLSNNKVENEGRSYISANDIRDIAYSEELIQKEVLDNYKDKRILINVTGKLIGQINGLSVIDTGYFSFGKPIKITCSCYKGEGNIIDVQKESNLSGNIHSKSINILKGYINKLINSYTRLPVDFHLSFEQLYGRIDGDSASVAEVISIISALGKLPIKQNIAVTGSINQFGEVQPIGGVNEKIEGFFNVCMALDSVKDKGVLIPYSNISDIVLNHKVEEEISKGNFHIYTMRTVEEAMEVLFGDGDIKSDIVLEAVNREIQKYYSKK